MFAKAFKRRIVAYRLLLHRAAAMIQSIARMRFGLRRIQVERKLLIIKSAHPMLLKRVLTPNRQLRTCFWFKNPKAVWMLYYNYMVLLERTGFQPSRTQLEENIHELARRILARQTELVLKVQKVWRGILTRKISNLFRMEASRSRQFLASRVMKIQRLYRAHAARLLIPVLRLKARTEELLTSYLKEKEVLLRAKKRIHEREQVMHTYVQERRDELTVRGTSRIDLPKYHGGKKMAAFHDSVYGNDKLRDSMAQILTSEADDIATERSVVQDRKDRKQFILDRVKEYGSEGYGKRGDSKLSQLYCSKQNDITAFLSSDLSIFSGHKDDLNLKSAAVKKRVDDDDVDDDVDDDDGTATGATAAAAADSASITANRALFGVATQARFQSSRSKGMQSFFSDDLGKILQAEVENMTKDFSKKPLACKFRDYNTGKERGTEKNYKFPKDVNVDPMKWLNDDVDLFIKSKNHILDSKKKSVLSFRSSSTSSVT